MTIMTNVLIGLAIICCLLVALKYLDEFRIKYRKRRLFRSTIFAGIIQLGFKLSHELELLGKYKSYIVSLSLVTSKNIERLNILILYDPLCSNLYYFPGVKKTTEIELPENVDKGSLKILRGKLTYVLSPESFSTGILDELIEIAVANKLVAIDLDDWRKNSEKVDDEVHELLKNK